MDAGISSFITFLSIVWFLFYWILGGVFFAVIAILRLGRVRKVRFSCLFTLYAILCATVASYFGVHSAEALIRVCAVDAISKAKTILAVIGCGFPEIIGSFLLGIVVLLIGGFLLMNLSKSKAKPWFNLQQNENEETEEDVLNENVMIVPIKKSKFF